MINALLLGLVFSLAIAVLAWRLRALDKSGAIAAVIVGTIIFGIGGLTASIALIAFFISGSILSSLPISPNRKQKQTAVENTYQIDTGTLQRDGGRNWKQVVANGGLPTLGILLAQFIPALHTVAMYFYFGVIAASAADSWATELGMRYGSNVRDILTGRPAQWGVSGGISNVGMLASLAGSAFIGLTLLFDGMPSLRIFVGILITGFLGSIIDSVLGSSLQGTYWCEECRCLIEKPVHCFRPATLKKGYKIITNNVVNLVSSAISGLFLIGLLDFAK